MKRIFKRTISMILVSSMLTSMIFFSNLVVFAVDPDNQGSVGKCTVNGKNESEDVKSAWNNYVIGVPIETDTIEGFSLLDTPVDKGPVDIKLLGDWTIGDTLTVPKGKTVNLDMNGYMIKMPRNNYNSAKKHLDFIFRVDDEATFNIMSKNNNDLGHKGYTYKKDKDPGDGLWFDGNKTVRGAQGATRTDHTEDGAIISGYGCTSCMQIGENAKVNIENVGIMGMGERSKDSKTDFGAIYIKGSQSTLSVENSKIMYNASKKGGGAISVGGSSCALKLDRSIISDNKAKNGGGVYVDKVATNTRITNATIIEKCTATKSGGGIYVGAQAEFEKVLISGSKAKNGGGVYVDKAATNTKIIKGTITECEAVESGGGIYFGAKAGLSNVNIFSSKAKNGGGIYVDKAASDTKITGGKTMQCEATESGGGIYVGARAELKKVTIDEDNKAKNGGGIYIDAAATDTKITGDTIRKCEATESGGGIYVGAKAELDNITIDEGSKAKNGGGIYIDAAASDTKITNGTIMKCEATESGGGIYVNKSSGNDTSRKLSIINCNIEKNKAMKCGSDKTKTSKRIEYGGGGIYIVGKSKDNRLNIIKIKDTTITDNLSGGNGGGAYLGFINDITFDECTIQRNRALNGGGIYNNAYTNISIAYTDIRDNTALRSNGGGVYVENECNIKLSGSVKIDNNKSKKTKEGTTKEIENNLNFERTGKSDTYGVNHYAYIKGDAIIKGTTGGSSAVGITCENNRVISKPGMHMINKFEERAGEKKKIGFYADQVNGGENKKRHLEWQNTDRKRGDYRCIRMAAGSDLKASTIAVSTIKEGKVETVNNKKCNEQDVIKGCFSFSSNNEKRDISSVFYYSDGFFKDGPKRYNTQLATMSMNMAMAAFNSKVWESKDEKDPNRYKNKDRNIKKLFTNISCKDIFTSETYQKKPTSESIAVAIAHKRITLSGKSYELIPIAIRGSGYESEWASNFTVGPASYGEAEGFASAADQVMEHLTTYIDTHNALKNAIDNGTAKFWVVGYSRAGATANLTSKRLVDKYVVGREADKKNQVYGYCMENPQGGYVSAEPEVDKKGLLYNKNTIAEYDCIHNCINKTDLVPLVAPALIGFTRYGVDHYVPGDAGATQQPTRQIDEIKDSSKKLPEKYYALERSARDNSAWDVLSEDGHYNDQRTKMLKQLNSVNRFIAFDDSFETYNIPLSSTFSDNKSPFGKILDGIGAVLDANYVKQDEEVKDTRTVFKGSFNNQDKFLRAFVYNLFNWGLSAGNFNRENLRDRYAIENPNNKDDKSGAYTVQSALRGILKLKYEKTGEQFSLIKKFLEKQMGNAGISDFTVLVSAVYCNDYKKFSKKIIDIININNISDVALTKEEKNNIENYVKTLIVFLLKYVQEDINNSKLGYLATFYKNSDRLLQSHVPEVNLAWLRSYDDYYTHEADLAVELEA